MFCLSGLFIFPRKARCSRRQEQWTLRRKMGLFFLASQTCMTNTSQVGALSIPLHQEESYNNIYAHLRLVFGKQARHHDNTKLN